MTGERAGRMGDRQGLPGRVMLAVALMAMVSTAALAATQESFSSPEAGITTLADALTANDEQSLRTILGDPDGKLIDSGDAVADRHNRGVFLRAYREGHKLAFSNNGEAVLLIGEDEWPMPIPLVRSPDGWRFDSQQGENEILARRIGRNELAAIQVCLAIVDAEHEYAALDLHDSGMPEYAAQFASTPGKHDGLYWQTGEDEPLSPLAPLLVAATSEDYADAESRPLAPYHGYFYRILAKQGEQAPGGAYDYRIKGRMIGGFAVIAYPARYGASGIMSFLVNQNGTVYEANLGQETVAIASKMTAFNPDAGWAPVALPAVGR